MGVPWGCRCTLKISSHLLIWKGVVKSCFHHHQHLNFESHRPGTFKYTQMYWLSITVGQIALKPILCLKCPDCLTLVWPCSWAVVILRLDWGNCLLQGHVAAGRAYPESCWAACMAVWFITVSVQSKKARTGITQQGGDQNLVWPNHGSEHCCILD